MFAPYYPKIIESTTTLPCDTPAVTDAHEVFVPSVVKYLPLLAACEGAKALKAAVAVV
jgi:hypothetical protein